ncbi:MAG: hypothetical protein IKV20_01925 [Clostridia bacterium]|nr:hypothetical protein [Clostridia bacterium]
MQLFGGGNTLYITLAIIALFCVLHVITYLTRGKLSLAISIVNITLHILAIFAFLWLKLTISEATLAYLFSLFFHTMIHFIPCLLGLREKKGGEDE